MKRPGSCERAASDDFRGAGVLEEAADAPGIFLMEFPGNTIEPFYPKLAVAGPYPLGVMLRVHCVQLFYNNPAWRSECAALRVW